MNLHYVNMMMLGHQLPTLLLPVILEGHAWADVEGQSIKYYDVMTHKNHSEDGYGLIHLRLGGAYLRALAPKLAT